MGPKKIHQLEASPQPQELEQKIKWVHKFLPDGKTVSLDSRHTSITRRKNRPEGGYALKRIKVKGLKIGNPQKTNMQISWEGDQIFIHNADHPELGVISFCQADILELFESEEHTFSPTTELNLDINERIDLLNGVEVTTNVKGRISIFFPGVENTITLNCPLLLHQPGEPTTAKISIENETILVTAVEQKENSQSIPCSAPLANLHQAINEGINSPKLVPSVNCYPHLESPLESTIAIVNHLFPDQSEITHRGVIRLSLYAQKFHFKIHGAKKENPTQGIITNQGDTISLNFDGLICEASKKELAQALINEEAPTFTIINPEEHLALINPKSYDIEIDLDSLESQLDQFLIDGKTYQTTQTQHNSKSLILALSNFSISLSLNRLFPDDDPNNEVRVTIINDEYRFTNAHHPEIGYRSITKKKLLETIQKNALYIQTSDHLTPVLLSPKEMMERVLEPSSLNRGTGTLLNCQIAKKIIRTHVPFLHQNPQKSNKFQLEITEDRVIAAPIHPNEESTTVTYSMDRATFEAAITEFAQNDERRLKLPFTPDLSEAEIIAHSIEQTLFDGKKIRFSAKTSSCYFKELPVESISLMGIPSDFKATFIIENLDEEIILKNTEEEELSFSATKTEIAEHLAQNKTPRFHPINKAAAEAKRAERYQPPSKQEIIESILTTEHQLKSAARLALFSLPIRSQGRRSLYAHLPFLKTNEATETITCTKTADKYILQNPAAEVTYSVAIAEMEAAIDRFIEHEEYEGIPFTPDFETPEAEAKATLEKLFVHNQEITISQGYRYFKLGKQHHAAFPKVKDTKVTATIANFPDQIIIQTESQTYALGKEQIIAHMLNGTSITFTLIETDDSTSNHQIRSPKTPRAKSPQPQNLCESFSSDSPLPFFHLKSTRDGDFTGPGPYERESSEHNELRLFLGQMYQNPELWNDLDKLEEYLDLLTNLPSPSAHEIMHHVGVLMLFAMKERGIIKHLPETILSLQSDAFWEAGAHQKLAPLYQSAQLPPPDVWSLDTENLLLTTIDFAALQFDLDENELRILEGDPEECFAIAEATEHAPNTFDAIDWHSPSRINKDQIQDQIAAISLASHRDTIVRIVSSDDTITSEIHHALKTEGFEIVTPENSYCWFSKEQFERLESEQGAEYVRRLKTVLPHHPMIIAIKRQTAQAHCTNKIRLLIASELDHGFDLDLSFGVTETATGIKLNLPNSMPKNPELATKISNIRQKCEDWLNQLDQLPENAFRATGHFRYMDKDGELTTSRPNRYPAPLEGLTDIYEENDQKDGQ